MYFQKFCEFYLLEQLIYLNKTLIFLWYIFLSRKVSTLLERRALDRKF